MKQSHTLITLLICLMTLGSCKKPVETKEPVNVVAPAKTQLDTIYNGGGNEPGWRVQLISDATGKLSYDLLLNYGADHLTGKVDSLPSPGPNMASHYVLHDDTKPLILSISDTPCTDDADMQYETTVTLSDKKFILNGCGRFTKKE